LTTALTTPGTPARTFSTRAAQLLHVIPVIAKTRFSSGTWKPAFSIAWRTVARSTTESDSSNADSVEKLTVALEMQGKRPSSFSTRAAQLLQVMPSMPIDSA
jgi:hypothetical protein